MGPLSKVDYLAMQANIICLLLFFIAAAAVVRFPAWFQ